MKERHFTFLYLTEDSEDIVEHNATIAGGLLQAFDYALENIKPLVKVGTTVHVFEFHNGDSVGTIQA